MTVSGSPSILSALDLCSREAALSQVACRAIRPVRLHLMHVGVLVGVLVGAICSAPTALADASPVLAIVDTPGDAVNVATMDGWILVADGEAGLQCIDVTDPTAPVIRAWVPLSGLTQDVCVVGDLAYVAIDGGAKDTGGLAVVSVKHPESPSVLGLVGVPGDAAAVDVHGAYAYVADSTKDVLNIIDIRNPVLPDLIDSVGVGGSARDVAVTGSHAYVATYGKGDACGLVIVDISDPLRTRKLQTVEVPMHGAHVVELIGTMAFVGGDDVLSIVDISSPGEPVVVADRYFPEPLHALAEASDQRLIAGSASSDIHVFDVTYPSTPALKDTVSLAASAWGLAVRGSTLFVAGGTMGVSLVDTNCFEDSIVDECLAGTVDAAAGVAVDVLRVNGSTGGDQRTLTLTPSESVEVTIDAPPSNPAGPARFAFYVWGGRPTDRTLRLLPMGVGMSCMATPLTADGAAPTRVLNNIGSQSLFGVPTDPSTPAPSVIGKRSGGIGRPGVFFMQGLLVDRNAGGGKLAVTNGVTLVVE